MKELDNLPEVVTTVVAAPLLGRKPQTLRKWACEGNGPIKPVHVHGRLLWRVSDIRAILEGA